MSRRDSTIVARHEVPGLAIESGSVPEGTVEIIVSSTDIVVETELIPVSETLVHQVSDWCSGAAANFGWMREAKRENTRGGL